MCDWALQKFQEQSKEGGSEGWEMAARKGSVVQVSQTKSWGCVQHLSCSECEILHRTFPFLCEEGVASSPTTTVIPDLGGVEWARKQGFSGETVRKKWLRAFSST